MKILAWCSLLALSLSLAMATHQLVGEPPQLTLPQHPNVYVYVNNSAGEPQNLVLPCQLMDATGVTFEWFSYTDNPISAEMVPPEMVDPITGTLTVVNITEGKYASTAGVNYYCIATRLIGSSNYPASVRSRTITVFYASFGGFQNETGGTTSVSVALGSDVALECDVDLTSTNPPPEIVWRFGNGTVVDEIEMNNKRRFLENRRYLYIRILEAADLMPTYHCEVTNAFLDFTMQAPTTYALVDTLPVGRFLEYKPIGDLTAFVGNTSFEFAYVGGFHDSDVTESGTVNVLSLGPTIIPNVGNIAKINTITDPGMFTLSASVRYGGRSDNPTGTLTVHQLPQITSSPPDDREIVEGQDNLICTCEYEGSDDPRIAWFFNGQPIDPQSGVSVSENTLTIASPRVSNSGIYQCIVSNDFGDDQAAWLLEIRPLMEVQVVPYNITALNAFDDRDLGALIVQENATVVNFWVDVIADPCPDIVWFFNGTQLGPSNETFNYNNACRDGSSPSWRFNLDIMLTEATSGSYNATFTNLAGTTALNPSAYFTIPAPVSVVDLTLSFGCLKQGTDLTLRCNINGFPRPMVTFSFKGSAITPGEGIYDGYIERTFYDEILIRNINSSAEGLYGCEAAADGVETPARAQPQEYDFCTAPSIMSLTTTSNPQLGEPFFIRCSTTGTPQPDIIWKKDGLELEATADEVLRIVSTDMGRTSSVEVSEGRPEFNGVYECNATNAAGSANMSSRVQLIETNELPLPLGAIIGIAAGGVGVILLIAFIILLLVCVYIAGKKTSTGKYSANPAHMHGDFTDGRGNVDKDSDEEDGQPEAFNPQYESLPALRPAQPPSYKPTPSYPMGDDMEMKKVPLPDSDSYLGGAGGGYMMQDNGMAYRPGVDDFLSEDAQFV